MPKSVKHCVVVLGLLLSQVATARQSPDSARPIAASDSIYRVLRFDDSLLQAYKDLRSELMAQKVFEESKSRLIEWITLGGVASLSILIFGFFQVKNYFKDLRTGAEKKVQETSGQILAELRARIDKTIGEEMGKLNVKELEARLVNSGNQSLQDALTANKSSFDSFVEKKKTEIDGLIIDLIRRKKESEERLNQPLTGGFEKLEQQNKPVHRDKLDYTEFMFAIRNQGPEGSIVGFAVAAAVEYQIYKQLKKEIRISPRYIYNYARQKSGDLKMDTGMTALSGVEIVKTVGAVKELDWPYKAQVDLTKPPPPDLEKVERFIILNSYPANGLEDMLEAMVNYGPIILSIQVFPSFYQHKDGVIPIPGKNEKYRGGASTCAVGFDREKATIKIRLAWGPEWGDKGYGYLPFEYIQKDYATGFALDGVKWKKKQA